MTRAVLVTGAAVLWSGGTTVRDFTSAVIEGRHALGKLTRMQAEDGSDLFGGTIDDGAVDALIPKNERRGMDRFGKLNVAGSTLAVLDAGYTPDRVASGALSDAGLVLSTSFGPWESTNRFVKELIDEGPLGTSARVFPNTVLNSAQGRTAIALKMRGPSSTLTGVPALAYAFDLIQLGRAARVLAGGVDEIYPNQLTAYSADGTLAPQAPDQFLGRPFAAESRGASAGEAFAACFYEDSDSATARGARVLGRVLGYGVVPDGRIAQSFAHADPEGRAAMRAMKLALDRAGISAGEVDAVLAAGNGCRNLDEGERCALAHVFGSDKRPVIAVKAASGECFGASVALGVVAAVGLFGARPELRRVLVNGFDIGGNYSSFVLGAPVDGARA